MQFSLFYPIVFCSFAIFVLPVPRYCVFPIFIEVNFPFNFSRTHAQRAKKGTSIGKVIARSSAREPGYDVTYKLILNVSQTLRFNCL